jgi:ABC-2 type transport system permease protein
MIGEKAPVAGSIAFGLEFAATGAIFAAIGGIAAQITTGAGAARGIAVAVLGVSFVLRVVGDVSSMNNGEASGLVWVSPLGWVERIDPYTSNQFWVAGLAFVATGLVSLVAVLLSARRDVGAGLVQPRLGPAGASTTLRSPLALAWRLHRGLLFAWSAGFAVLGVVFGSLAKGIGDMVGTNQAMQQIFARLGGATGLIDAYLATVGSIFGLIAAGYGVQAALRMRAEEARGGTELILGTAVGRLRWAGSHLVFALLGPAVALAIGGLTTGLTHAANMHDSSQVGTILGACMVQLLAVWVLTCVAVLFVGVLPQYAPVAWGGLGLAVLLTVIGGAINLSHWVLDLSPFTHLPRLPGGHVVATPLVVLVLLTAALLGLGLGGLRRRDIPVA